MIVRQIPGFFAYHGRVWDANFTLAYDQRDPHAVKFSLETVVYDKETASAYITARETFCQVVETQARAGEMDVVIEPSFGKVQLHPVQRHLHTVVESCYLLHLQGTMDDFPDVPYHAHAFADRIGLEAFVYAMLATVPRGQEHQDMDVFERDFRAWELRN